MSPGVIDALIGVVISITCVIIPCGLIYSNMKRQSILRLVLLYAGFSFLVGIPALILSMWIGGSL